MYEICSTKAGPTIDMILLVNVWMGLVAVGEASGAGVVSGGPGLWGTYVDASRRTLWVCVLILG